MIDLIDRQAAIDAMWKIRRQQQMLDDTHKADMVMHGIYLAEKALEQLPPAQQEQKIGKIVRWMEKRETPDYISYTPHCKCSLCGNELLIESINYCYMCGAILIEDREAEGRKE